MPTPNIPPVLIVEDEELVRMTLVEDLLAEGVEVHDARSVQDAWSIFKAEPRIGIVVADVNLKGDSGGLKFCDAVRASRPECRIIIASGETVEPDRVPGAERLAKPYSGADLLRALGEEPL